jgi:hypothetical protein
MTRTLYTALTPGTHVIVDDLGGAMSHVVWSDPSSK